SRPHLCPTRPSLRGPGAPPAFAAGGSHGKPGPARTQIATTRPGLPVVHPLFVSRPAEGAAVVDLADPFDDIDARIPAGTTQPLPSATFLAFAASDPITIHFLDLEAP